MSKDRSYQAALIAAINAELGARGWSRRELLARADLSENTMERVFRLQRDLNVRQIEQMAEALGVAPEYLAHQAALRRGATPTPPVDTDVRTTIQWLLANPTYDPELNHRLSEADHQVDLSGQQRGRLLDTIKEVRREELNRALAALPPSEKQGGNNGSSGMSA